VVFRRAGAVPVTWPAAVLVGAAVLGGALVDGSVAGTVVGATVVGGAATAADGAER
jgi:hypothetical protein